MPAFARMPPIALLSWMAAGKPGKTICVIAFPL